MDKSKAEVLLAGLGKSGTMLCCLTLKSLKLHVAVVSLRTSLLGWQRHHTHRVFIIIIIGTNNPSISKKLTVAAGVHAFTHAAPSKLVGKSLALFFA